jgi:hypothetical protein
VSGPSGVSHLAVVTPDLDRFRAFYESTIGLQTTMVLAAGSAHARQAAIVVGDVMLHVFEVVGYDPAAHGFAPRMFERGRLDHLGFTVADEAALSALRDGCWPPAPPAATSVAWAQCSPSASTTQPDLKARSTVSTRPTTRRWFATRTRSSIRCGSSGPSTCCAPLASRQHGDQKGLAHEAGAPALFPRSES